VEESLIAVRLRVCCRSDAAIHKVAHATALALRVGVRHIVKTPCVLAEGIEKFSM